MPNLLVIDTSQGAVAAWVGDISGSRPQVVTASNPDARSHSEALAPLIGEVLAGGRTVDAVAVGVGPAPFTGLRAGIVAAEAFAFARGVPVWGVPSLDAIARAYYDSAELEPAPQGIVVVSDARRSEVYAASYNEAGRTGEFTVCQAADLHLPAGVRCVGPGTVLYPELAGEDLGVDPLALGLLAWERAQAGTPQPTRPLYLRRPDVQLPHGRKRATN